MEVFYRRGDGVLIRGWAYLSHRTIPPQWMIGDVRLSDVKRVSKLEWLMADDERPHALRGEGPEWIESAKAMIR